MLVGTQKTTQTRQEREKEESTLLSSPVQTLFILTSPPTHLHPQPLLLSCLQVQEPAESQDPSSEN